MLPSVLKNVSLTIREHYSQRKDFISFQSALFKRGQCLARTEKTAFLSEKTARRQFMTQKMQAEYKGLNKMQNHFPLLDHHSKCRPTTQQVKKSPAAASPPALQGHSMQNHVHHLSTFTTESILASLQIGGQPQQLHCSYTHPRSRATRVLMAARRKCWSCQEHGHVLWWEDLSPAGIVWLHLLIAGAGIHRPGLWAKHCSVSGARWWGLQKRASKHWAWEQDRAWA